MIAFAPALLSSLLATGSGAPPPPPAEIREIRIEAISQVDAFRSSTAPDERYHALVWSGGGAAGKALLVTDVSDREVASALRSMGASDGGGVPLRAWSWRSIPFVPQPEARVSGTRVRVLIHWEGMEAPRPLTDFLVDSGGTGAEFRFGGNEEHDAHWDSGCILCLYSCPGGVLSNALLSIRDHQNDPGRFDVDSFPGDGTPVTVILQIQG